MLCTPNAGQNILFSRFPHEKREKEKKQEKKKKNEAQTCVIWACTKTLVKGSLQQQLQNKNCLTLTLDFYLGHLRTKEEEV